jgi:NOL1/NOP2/fmu family ribosome biogenesis protein
VKSLNLTTKKEDSILSAWMEMDGFQFIKKEETVYAWPGSLVRDMGFLLHHSRVLYSGIRAGDLVRDKFIPDHALAMSRIVKDETGEIELDIEQSIQYLQRKNIQPANPGKGWQLVRYTGQALGWVNVLPNRVNNYYPKELRILKDRQMDA